ncbi:MAG: AAA family ATPase, partial [Ferruginibacter sp.]
MTKIDNIEIKNFKSIRDAKISDCRRVNIFIGYPNVGKSNILEALSLFSINDVNADFSKYVRIEKSTGLFFDGNVSEPAKINVNSQNRIRIDYKSNEVHLSNEFDREKYGFDSIDSSAFNVDKKYPVVISAFDIPHEKIKIASFSGSNRTNNVESIADIHKYQFDRNGKF